MDCPGPCGWRRSPRGRRIKPDLDHNGAFLIDFDQEMNHICMLGRWYSVEIIKIIFTAFYCGKIV